MQECKDGRETKENVWNYQSKSNESKNPPIRQPVPSSVWIVTRCKPSEGTSHLTLLWCLD